MDTLKTRSFSHRAAHLSWVCPVVTLIIFVLLLFSGEVVPREMIALVASGALCLTVIGVVFGVVALSGISKHGTKGIRAPAIVGLTINVLLLSLVVTNAIAAKARATHQQGSIETPSVVAMQGDLSLL